MKKQASPSFDTLSEALNDTTRKLHAAEVHGLLSGLICGKPHEISTAWETLITSPEDQPKVHQVLTALYHSTRSQLVDFLFEFDLVLPEDSVQLSARAESLALWVQGFLTGLKLADVPLTGREASDLTEALNDLIEIAQMNYEQVLETEEDEQAFAELVEYVRMVVVFVYQEQVGEGKSSVPPAGLPH